MRPFAVYGTLRPGGRLAPYWEGTLEADPETTHIDGYSMYAVSGWAFPFVVEDVNGRIVVDVLRLIDRGDYDYMLNTFDRIEGVSRRMYSRETVVTSDGEEVWLYVARDEWMTGDLSRPVPGNDWMAYTEAVVS